MKVKELIEKLEENGWKFVRQKGSHRQYKHPDEEKIITVPGHKMSEDLPKGIESAILKMAKLK
ncbi:MAG: type II toxin-antitoxin system HicA family toxin [Bacteroidales bacterium]|nr:type II toxin-antitoxin system HicA family toxin [Bacteroidales bacterium]NCU36288.1 addiction module toxin, HicA family [Candidatus Falkowbacteria bacterium]MDD2631832.1 type II toxin-antitoxin system HicA family toxin [Bacteroidales bacterium]MDD3130723.1 type II toxin-antitoxin system HicA family toxin [Bacteroidales bacterium]MDD4176362.1 type II toxin-antitoxin system HicA family toxin [Bacteroidales bacterium]